MITEQTKVTVEFTIHELLHIHDQLLIAHDETYEDNKTICCYLMDRINEQLPDFTESKDFYKPIIPANYDKN
jgi:hypothetical protein